MEENNMNKKVQKKTGRINKKFGIVLKKHPYWVVGILSAIGTSVLNSFMPSFTNYLFTSHKHITSEYSVIHAESTMETSGLLPLKLDYKKGVIEDKIDVKVVNDGGLAIPNLKFEMTALKKPMFTNPIIQCSPSFLPLDGEPVETPGKIFRAYKRFLVHSELILDIHGNSQFIENQTFKISVADDEIAWPVKQKTIYPKSWFGIIHIVNKCWERIGFTSNLHSEEIPLSLPPPRSGVSMGGYDPLVLSYNILSLLVKKDVLKTEEARAIFDFSRSSGGSVLISGIDFLKLNQALINKLIEKNKITKEGAENIIKQSTQVGGVLINGYNIIFINAAILNTLCKDDLISLVEAQEAINSAKVN